MSRLTYQIQTTELNNAKLEQHVNASEWLYITDKNLSEDPWQAADLRDIIIAMHTAVRFTVLVKHRFCLVFRVEHSN